MRLRYVSSLELTFWLPYPSRSYKRKDIGLCRDDGLMAPQHFWQHRPTNQERSDTALSVLPSARAEDHNLYELKIMNFLDLLPWTSTVGNITLLETYNRDNPCFIHKDSNHLMCQTVLARTAVELDDQSILPSRTRLHASRSSQVPWCMWSAARTNAGPSALYQKQWGHAGGHPF